MYLRKSQERGALRTPFLWVAFFLPLVWLSYRRLYWGVAIFLGVCVGIAVAQEFVPFLMRIDRYIGIGICGGVAVSGKMFVVTFAARAAGKADAAGLTGEVRRDFLASRGGTSWISALLAGIFTLGSAGWLLYLLWGSPA